MGKSKSEGWSKAEEDWINSLSIDDFVDLNIMAEYGIDTEEEEEKLNRLRESYAKAIGKK